MANLKASRGVEEYKSEEESEEGGGRRREEDADIYKTLGARHLVSGS